MKISRKIKLHVEMKIRHGLATGSLPVVERSSPSPSLSQQIPAKSSGAETDSTK
jgi:hypothetical protein